MALTDNLLAYWKFDESSGNAADSSGNGRTLTNTGTVSYAAGKINNCGDFGTSNSGKAFDRTDNAGVLPNSFSLSAWIKCRTELGTGASTLLLNFRTTGTGTQYVDWTTYYRDTAGTKALLLSRDKPGVSENAVSRTGALGTSNWHHIAATYNGSTLEGFYNGSSIGTLSTSGYGSGGANSVHFGGYSWGYSNFSLDEIGIWSTNLSSSDITTLYNGGAGLAYPFSASSSVKSVDGLAKASVKSKNGLAVASIKNFNGLA